MRPFTVLSTLLVILCVYAAPVRAQAGLFVDSAPGLQGSDDWDIWWANAKPDVVDSGFQNMRNGTLGQPGNLLMDPLDEISYSTGDNGRRLDWIFWLPAVLPSTVDTNVQMKLLRDVGGEELYWDWALGDWAWVSDIQYPDQEPEWGRPDSYEAYGGGTIGTFGYTLELTEEGLETSRQEFLLAQTFAQGSLRYFSLGTGYDKRDESGWHYRDLRLEMDSDVPEPSALVLLGVVIVGATIVGRRRRG